MSCPNLALVHTSIEHSRDWCRSLLILNCQELAAQQPLRPINWCSRLLKMTFGISHKRMFLRELSSAFTRTKGGEAPPLIRPPEISPRQAEGRASLTGPKSPARASAAMTAAALSRVDDGSGGYRQPLAQPRHRGRTASDLGVVCGRGRNPTLRLWPTIFSGKIDVFPGDRRSRLISSMTSVAPA